MPGGPKRPKSEAERQRDRVRYLENARGIKHTIAPDAAMRRINIWRQKGISLDTIAERTGVSKAQIRNIQNGLRGWIRTSTHQKIMGARFTLDDVSMFSSVGVRRRLCALAALGFTTLTLGDILARDRRYVHAIMVGKNAREMVLRPIGLAVHQAYEKYRDIDPMTLGQDAFATNYAKSTARRNHWGSPAEWDDDTIDDPDAYPEFTGECGRMRGVMIHLREDIPICPRCQDAVVGGRAAVDPFEVFDLYSKEGMSIKFIAERFGVRRDLIHHYTSVLRPPKHNLSNINRPEMRAECEACGPVDIRSAGHRPDGTPKLICWYSVDKKRKSPNAPRAESS